MTENGKESMDSWPTDGPDNPLDKLTPEERAAPITSSPATGDAEWRARAKILTVLVIMVILGLFALSLLAQSPPLPPKPIAVLKSPRAASEMVNRPMARGVRTVRAMAEPRQLRLAWTPGNPSATSRDVYEVWQSTDLILWTLWGVTANTSWSFKTDQPQQFFRLRARDVSGNVSDWATVP